MNELCQHGTCVCGGRLLSFQFQEFIVSHSDAFPNLKIMFTMVLEGGIVLMSFRKSQDLSKLLEPPFWTLTQ